MGNIGYINRMIYGVDAVNDMPDSEKKQYKAEALILRAMVYFDMVRIWGNVPLVTSLADDITAENIVDVYHQYFPPQTDEESVYKQIEKDLLDALADAPDNNPQDKTMMTKSVARALLAKVYAEKPLRDYDKVIQYADALANDGFELVNDFSELFGVVLNDENRPPAADNEAIAPKARNSKESIFEAQFFAGSESWVTWMFGRRLDNFHEQFFWAKWITPSRDLTKAFLSESGDKRYAESVVWYACGWNIYYPADNYAFMYKCRSGLSSIIKMRYADILLLKAEALIGKNDFSGAATIINQTRNRAGLGNLPASATANKEAILNAYLKERRLELAFECQRWFDLVRLDKVEEVMNAVFDKDEGRPPQV
jgi:hypothetical protein